jgi:peptide/nickel transport system substrate-binding protein
MENRFGVKDFIILSVMTLLIVLVIVAFFQYDRQWGQLQAIRDGLNEQRKELRDIQDRLRQGVAVNVTQQNATATTQSANSASLPPNPPTANIDPKNDPFGRLRAAQALPNYARGDWLIDAFGNTVGKLTPLISSDAYQSQVEAQVVESLITRDPVTLDWKPLLATEWKIEDNTQAHKAAVEKLKAEGKSDEDIAKDESLPHALKIRFKMRPGVAFSDGTPLTADDVVFTHQFIMNPAINAPRAKAYYARIKSVEKTAPDEVTFTFREPYFESLGLAGGMGIMARHFYGQFSAEDFNNSVGYLLGSGPYRMEDPRSWKPGTQIQLVRNDRYWGVAPAFDRLIYKEIPADSSHLAAFRNGDIDAFLAFPEQYQEMIADAGLVARSQHYDYQNPSGGYRYIAWNQKRNGQSTFFTDKRVRKALTHLVDRERMVQEIMLGYAVPATGPFNPLSKQYNKDVKLLPYDPKQARELLREAGFEDRNSDGVLEDPSGKRFQFKLTYPGGNQNYHKMALFLKDAFARGGIVMEPDPLDWSLMVERLNKKDFDAITLAWTAGIESDIYQMFHSSQAVADGDNFMSYINPELDRAIETARTTVDEKERLPHWHKAHAIIAEDQPYTFLMNPKSLVFLDQRIANVQKLERGLNPRDEWFVPIDKQRWTK